MAASPTPARRPACCPSRRPGRPLRRPAGAALALLALLLVVGGGAGPAAARARPGAGHGARPGLGWATEDDGEAAEPADYAPPRPRFGQGPKEVHPGHGAAPTRPPRGGRPGRPAHPGRRHR